MLFSKHILTIKKKTKPGKGSEMQSTVLVMAKVVPKRGRPKKQKKSSVLRFVKIEVISNSGSGQINKTVSEYVASVSTVKSDAWRGFKRLREVISDHIKRSSHQKRLLKCCSWVQTMISNTKRNLLGTNHQIKDEYLQNYLNEFCYKTNRRYFGTNLLRG